MGYEKIILELIERVKALEEKVDILTKRLEGGAEEEKSESREAEPEVKIGTARIRDYIESLLDSARQSGKEYLDLSANEIHKELGLRRRMPTVCNAMKQCMRDGDDILRKTASGYSSTFEIRYKTGDRNVGV